MKNILSKYFKGDPVIWVIVIALSLFSLLAVYSSIGALAYKVHAGNTTFFLIKQGLFLLFGIGIVWGVHLIPYKIYSGLSPLLLFIALVLLPATLIVGSNLNNASRWLPLPGGFTFQTSDFAKLVLIMFIARVLSRNQNNLNDIKSAFLPIVIAVGLVCMFIFPANFSTSALIFVTSLVLMFLGRIKNSHLFLLIGSVIVFMSIFLLLIFTTPQIFPRGETWKNRIVNFGNEEAEGNFQAEQAKIAIANGAPFGRGPGNSIQRNFLPHPYSDFIFAIIVEEYGLLGGLVVLSLYLFLLYRAGIIVRNSQRTFPAFLAIGLAFSLVFQALINMAVAVNLFPVTGQTLPFVSMGGTSIFFTGTALGIILSISRDVQKTKVNEQAA